MHNIILIFFGDKGKDAIRPFIVDWPSTIYDKSEIDVDAMFGFCSLVCAFILVAWIDHSPEILDLIRTVSGISLFSQECMSFYSSFFDEIYDLKGLDRNFTLRLPFRQANLSYDSAVSSNFPICLFHS